MKRILFLFLLFSSIIYASVGSVSLIEGEVIAKRDGQTFTLKLADNIKKDDFIETKINSKVKITFIDNTIVTIGKDSSLHVTEYLFDGTNSKTELNVTKGAFHTITGEIGKVNPTKFKLKTKNATIGIRGTEFYGDENRIVCTSGAISVLSNGILVDVPAGNFTNILPNQNPSEAQPLQNDSLDEIEERLNTNSTNNVSNSFENPSDTLTQGNSQENLNTGNSLDSQNSWGYWASSIQDEHSETKIAGEIDKQQANNILSLTPTSYIAEQLNSYSIKDLNFQGSFYGDNITDAGYINLDFQIGGNLNTLSANYNFGYNMMNYSGTLSSDQAISQLRGDEPYFFEASNYMDTVVKGQFYGDTMNSVKGTVSNFDFNNSDAIVNFSAKQ